MRSLAVVQSRLGSSRLPGKAMLSVAGMPSVVLSARRAANTGLEVVVATSTEAEDDVVAAAVTAAKLDCFRGPLDDPLNRFLGAVERAGLADDDLVVRLTADNMAPDGTFISFAINQLLAGGLGYVRVDTRTVYGLGVEVFTAGSLRSAAENAVDSFDHEHVTPWIRRNVGDDVVTPPMDETLLGLRCTMDTLDDYVVAARVFDGVADPVGAPWHELLVRWNRFGPPYPALRVPTRPNALGQGPWVFGSVQLGMDYGAANSTGMPDRAAAVALVREAAGLGASHVDTARAYGESERRVGAALATGLQESLAVVTKIEPLTSLLDDAPAAWCRAAVRASAEASLRRLGLDRVGALLLHRWADWGRGRGAVAAALAELQSEGLAEVIGVSVGAPDELVAALADPRVGYVQLPFNLFDRRWLADDVRAKLAARADVVVTVRSVFLQGLLAAPNTARWPVVDGVDPAALREALAGLVNELGRRSPADLALAYVRAQEFVTSTVLGAETVEQVREQAELFATPALTSAEVELVHARIPAQPVGLVDPSLWRAREEQENAR